LLKMGPIKARGTEYVGHIFPLPGNYGVTRRHVFDPVQFSPRYRTRQSPMRVQIHASGKRLSNQLSLIERILVTVQFGVGGARSWQAVGNLRHPTHTAKRRACQLNWATYTNSPWSARRAAISYLARFISSLPGTSHSRLGHPIQFCPPSIMSAHPYHRHPDPRGRELSRRPSASDEDSFFSESSSIVEKHNHHRPRSHHRDPPRGRRTESSRHRKGDDEDYLPHHHDRHHNDDRRGSPDSDSGAVVRREEVYTVQHIPRDSSVASSTARTCVYDHRDPRDRYRRSRRYYRDYDDDRSPPDEKRHQRERNRFDPRVILATLLFAATAALCYKEISSGGKKRGGGRRTHGGRAG
ncbi:hypothetical protein PpBr36_01016, partial [Pyricularia pennisetigena]|uniref:hypothetical protein n=1 Tax=Pyricularia pennisetigena TaxID=1578925 RepID=UPI001151EDD7